METSLLSALCLERHIVSHPQTDFLSLLFFFPPRFIKPTDVPAACAIRVFSILVTAACQQYTTALSELVACEEAQFQQAGSLGCLKSPSQFSSFHPSLISFWKLHCGQNGNTALGASRLEILVVNSCWTGRISPQSMCLGALTSPSAARRPNCERPSTRHLRQGSEAVPGKIITLGKINSEQHRNKGFLRKHPMPEGMYAKASMKKKNRKGVKGGKKRRKKKKKKENTH